MGWSEGGMDWRRTIIKCVIISLILVPIVFFIDMRFKDVSFANIEMYDEKMNRVEGIIFNQSDHSVTIEWFYIKNTGLQKTVVVSNYSPEYDNVTIEVQIFVFITKDKAVEGNILNAGQTAICKATFARWYVKDFEPITLTVTARRA